MLLTKHPCFAAWYYQCVKIVCFVFYLFNQLCLIHVAHQAPLPYSLVLSKCSDLPPPVEWGVVMYLAGKDDEMDGWMNGWMMRWIKSLRKMKRSSLQIRSWLSIQFQLTPNRKTASPAWQPAYKYTPEIQIQIRIPTHSKKKHSELGLTSSVLIQTEIQIQIQIKIPTHSK